MEEEARISHTTHVAGCDVRTYLASEEMKANEVVRQPLPLRRLSSLAFNELYGRCTDISASGLLKAISPCQDGINCDLDLFRY